MPFQWKIVFFFKLFYFKELKENLAYHEQYHMIQMVFNLNLLKNTLAKTEIIYQKNVGAQVAIDFT